MVFSGEPTNEHRTVGLAWHKLGIYVKLPWKDIMAQIRPEIRIGRITLAKGKARMEAFFWSTWENLDLT